MQNDDFVCFTCLQVDSGFPRWLRRCQGCGLTDVRSFGGCHWESSPVIGCCLVPWKWLAHWKFLKLLCVASGFESFCNHEAWRNVCSSGVTSLMLRLWALLSAIKGKKPKIERESKQAASHDGLCVLGSWAGWFLSVSLDQRFSIPVLAPQPPPPPLHISYVTLITSEVCSIRT